MNFGSLNIKMLQLHRKLILCVVVPSVFVIISFCKVYKPVYEIIPQYNSKLEAKYKFNIFSDSLKGGDSRNRLVKRDKLSVAFRYTLGNKLEYPFAGISFAIADTTSFIDLSGYDYVSITIKAKKGLRVPFTFSEYVPSYYSKGQPFKNRNLQYIFNVSNKVTVVTAPLNKFTTPDWWYALNHTTETKFTHPNFGNIKDLIIGNCYNLKRNVEDEIEIYDFSVHVDYSNYYKFAATTLLVYFALLLLISYIYKPKTLTQQKVL